MKRIVLVMVIILSLMFSTGSVLAIDGETVEKTVDMCQVDKPLL